MTHATGRQPRAQRQGHSAFNASEELANPLRRGERRGHGAARIVLLTNRHAEYHCRAGIVDAEHGTIVLGGNRAHGVARVPDHLAQLLRCEILQQLRVAIEYKLGDSQMPSLAGGKRRRRRRRTGSV